MISAKDLPAILARDMNRLRNEVEDALSRTAIRAIAPIRKRVPKAFGELKDSIHADDVGTPSPKTVADAPHAAAVEVGSRPHKPDWERLLAWVKLRGMQGLTRGGRLRKRFNRSEGPTTPQQARSVASAIKNHEVRGKRGVGRHTPIDAPEQVARAISKAIEVHGTKPHWYVAESLPDVEKILHDEVKRALTRAANAAKKP